MKVYFISTVDGNKPSPNNHQLIRDTLIKLEAELLGDVNTPSASAKDSKKTTTTNNNKLYEQVQHWIGQADLVIAEVSSQSIRVGHEAALALAKNKPVILLHQPNKKPDYFKEMEAERLQLIEYSFENLEEKLKQAITQAYEQQDTRFNFFISPSHQAYLDWIALNRRIPRSVFLRRLIEQHMVQNEEYQG